MTFSRESMVVFEFRGVSEGREPKIVKFDQTWLNLGLNDTTLTLI